LTCAATGSAITAMSDSPHGTTTAAPSELDAAAGG